MHHPLLQVGFEEGSVLLCLIYGHVLEVLLLAGAAGASAPFLAVPAPQGCRQGGVCVLQGVPAAGSWGRIQQPVVRGGSRTTRSCRWSAPRKVSLPVVVFFWLSTPSASPNRRGAVQGRCLRLSTARLDAALAPSR